MIIPAHHAAGLLTMLRIDPSIVSPNMDGSGTTCSTVSCACPALYSNPLNFTPEYCKQAVAEAKAQ